MAGQVEKAKIVEAQDQRSLNFRARKKSQWAST